MEVASALVKHTRESNSTPNSVGIFWSALFVLMSMVWLQEDQMTKTCLRLSGEALSLVEPLNILGWPRIDT